MAVKDSCLLVGVSWGEAGSARNRMGVLGPLTSEWWERGWPAGIPTGPWSVSWRAAGVLTEASQEVGVGPEIVDGDRGVLARVAVRQGQALAGILDQGLEMLSDLGERSPLGEAKASDVHPVSQGGKRDRDWLLGLDRVHEAVAAFR